MSDTAATPPDIDLEAAEYVLGTLDSAERAAFERRMRREDAARRATSGWERRFAGLIGRVDPVAPPSAVWERIERALAGASERSRVDVVAFETRLAVSRSRWRAAALSLGALAAALAAVVVADLSQPRIAPPARGERYIAAVTRDGDQPALIVRVDLSSRQIFVMPVAAEAPAGRSLELWYIGDGKPPRAMGLLDKSPASMPIPAGAGGSEATFAVSVEPPGGSTTGGPTGPVVYSGKLIKE